MQYMFDTANIADIEKYGALVPYTGVTSNPSIIKKEGAIDFFTHFRRIREIIGFERSLHIQVLAEDCEGILADAEAILKNVDDQVFIKIPVTMEGLKAMQMLKSKGVGVTATAIYTRVQGYMAMEAGADFIAPYFNRMENLDIDPRAVISDFAAAIDTYGYQTIILAASFKNMGQVNDAFACGAQAATMGIDLLTGAFAMPSIKKAVDDFAADWYATFGPGATIPGQAK